MGGVLLLCAFLLCGLPVGAALLQKENRITQLWFGAICGLILMMTLPCFAAFLFDYTRPAIWVALAVSVFMSVCVSLYLHLTAPSTAKRPEKPYYLLLVAIPLTVLFAYLQYTHYFREAEGAYYVGQSTYGDICMHSSIITSLANASFPPDYSILPGNRMGYPFFVDAMSTAMLLFGTPLSLSMAIPGTIMGFLTFLGFGIFADRICNGRKAVIFVACILLFLNGGLGFLYTFSPESFSAIFTEYYQAPCNMPDLNLRWVNIICDMLLPQRSFLAGCTVFIGAVYFLYDLITEKREQKLLWFAMGIYAGLTVMIHTHSFLALAIISLYLLISGYCRKDTRSLTKNMIIYGIVAACIALPQLFTWTFRQSGTSWLRFAPGWVNTSEADPSENVIWFWIKNMGPAFLLIIPATLVAEQNTRRLCTGGIVLFLLANLVQFQRLLYDNNKLMYSAYILFCPAIALLLSKVYDRIKTIPLKRCVAACFLSICCLSAILSIIRECISDYCIFSSSEVMAAEYLKEHTPEHCTVLTGTQHNNLASVLAGKKLVCGSPGFLYTHGLDYVQQSRDAESMYTEPSECEYLFLSYHVDYILLSQIERSEYTIDEDWLSEKCETVFNNDDVTIFRYISDTANN